MGLTSLPPIWTMSFGFFWRLPLRGIASLGASIEDLKIIDFLFIISHLEQSATVLHSSLTVENSNDLERVQKSAVKILLGNPYNGYENSLLRLKMEKLVDRRRLCLNFAKKCFKSNKTKYMFPKNAKRNDMKTRTSEKYMVEHANTERLRKSSIMYMQHLLNEDEVED